MNGNLLSGFHDFAFPQAAGEPFFRNGSSIYLKERL